MEFTLQTIIKASAERIFKAWLDSEQHSKMTGGKAVCSSVIGDNFSAWDGYITGTNLTIEPFRKIVQTWRTDEFDKDEKDSLLEILFEEIPEGTEMTLNHSRIPKDGSNYIEGWEDHYFKPMKDFFI